MLVLLVGIGAGWIALRADADDPDRHGLVVGVVDGDTVDVRVLATRERVRVLGIDTPETGSCLSRQATAETNRLTLGRLVKLQRDPSQPERDRFDRLLAYVQLSGERDLGLELVKRGFARVFVGGRPFKRLESYRKAEPLGRAQSPSIWRCEAPEVRPNERRAPTRRLPGRRCPLSPDPSARAPIRRGCPDHFVPRGSSRKVQVDGRLG